MRTLLCFLLIILGFGHGKADTQAPEPVGIIILKAIAGYDAAAVSFVSIQWVDTNGGYVVDNTGKRTAFINDAIGRILYFDQAYYEEVDHNQNWTNWRAGLQYREIVLPPVDSIALTHDDFSRLHNEELVLEDIVQRYPAGNSLLAPIIAVVADDSAKLSNGLVLQNGKWIPQKEATAPAGIAIVGESNQPVTFTTKDGVKYVNVKVAVTDTGLSVLTSDGGASVTFAQLPDDLSPFSEAVRAKIHDSQVKVQQEQAAEVASKKSVLDNVETSTANTWHKVWDYFSSSASKPALAGPNVVPPGPAAPTASNAAPAPKTPSTTPAIPAPAKPKPATTTASPLAPGVDPMYVPASPSIGPTTSGPLAPGVGPMTAPGTPSIGPMNPVPTTPGGALTNAAPTR